MNWTPLKYGWVAIAGLVVTGTTIYVIDNLRKHIEPQDVIEEALGTVERCLATGVSLPGDPYDNPTPHNFVRTWYSNYYTTSGVVSTAFIVTNAFGWHVDEVMVSQLDAKIKELVPHFLDSDQMIANGDPISKPALVYLTVTGLWARLQIGDKTNQFTRSPAWTNAPVTNYVITYTNWWPSTNYAFARTNWNGTNWIYFAPSNYATTTNCYTSHVDQAVNYATNWNGTNWAWTTQSNWPSFIKTDIHAVVYGVIPWQMYAEDFVERYKVLEALQWTAPLQCDWANTSEGYRFGHSSDKATAESLYATTGPWGNNYCPYAFTCAQGTGFYSIVRGFMNCSIVANTTTQVTKNVHLFLQGTNTAYVSFIGYDPAYDTYDDNGDGIGQNVYTEILPAATNITNGTVSHIVGNTNLPAPTWVDDPPAGETYVRGYSAINPFGLVEWNFQYCTNHYW